MKEKIVAIILSLTMIIGLGGTMHTPANAAETKSVSKQVNDILDAKNADVTANFKANVKGEEVTEQLYRTFRQLSFDYNSDYGSYEDGKLVLTKEGEAFYNRMLKLGIASGLNEDGEPIGADVLDLKGTVKSSVIDSQNFNLDLYLQLAKGKNAKAISLNYNNGKIKINLGTLVSFVKEYTGRTVNDIYDALEIPAIEELTLNGISELNKYLKSELGIREVLSYTVYTEEDGEDVADKIGCIKDVNYGEKMYPNFNISSEQLMSTGKDLLALVLNTADDTLGKFETKSGTKSTISVTEKNATELIKRLSLALGNNAEVIINSAADRLFALPGFDEVAKSYPKGYLDAVKKEMVFQVKSISRNLDALTKEEEVKDEGGNIIKYIPIEQAIEMNKVKASANFTADTKGKKGSRDALFTGSIKFASGEGKEATSVDISFDVSVKEKGTKSNDTKPSVKKVKKGYIVKAKSGTYVVTSTSKKTVSLKAAKNKKTVKIPATVTIGKDKYKVTAIGKKAFKNCNKTKKVVIGKNIEKIGKKAFSGINKKATIKCPKKSLKKYKKKIMKKSTGYKKTMTVK